MFVDYVISIKFSFFLLQIFPFFTELINSLFHITLDINSKLIKRIQSNILIILPFKEDKLKSIE